MSQQSSVSLSKKTKEVLVELKNFPNESFEEVIKRMISAYTDEQDDLLTDDDVAQIEKSLGQIKEGKYKTLEQLRQKYARK